MPFRLPLRTNKAMDIELTFPSTASVAASLLVAIRLSSHTFPLKLETVFLAPSMCPAVIIDAFRDASGN